MKKILALFLSVVMLFTGCGQKTPQEFTSNGESIASETAEYTIYPSEWENVEPQYNSLDDEQLLAHIEDLVYQDTVVSLNSKDYFVENVSAIYISKEYLDEVEFNSQSNIYFGYTLSELDDIFQGKKYVFTLSDSGTNTIQEFQEIEDTSTEMMLKNVAIGTGVILICVTVSAVTAGTVAPAVSMIFAASATTAETFAFSSAAFGGISAGIVRGIQTGDFNEAMKAAAMGTTEGFKWGALSGAVAGGSREAFLLKAATQNGLTMNEAALIQADSNLPVDIISQMHSMKEYKIYEDAGLKTMMVGGRTALVQQIDLNYVSQLPDGTEVTNLVRMQKGYAPLDPVTGKAYELHHIGQKNNGALAILTQEQHRGKGNMKALHDMLNDSGVDHGPKWKKAVSDFWKYLGNYYAGGGI